MGEWPGTPQDLIDNEDPGAWWGHLYLPDIAREVFVGITMTRSGLQQQLLHD
jgi:hypothetical protein